jgi:hypothetical protein
MAPDYAAVAVFSPLSGRWELMSSGGRVIVFDTAEVAWDWLPLLGGGRRACRDRSNLSVAFPEISMNAPNRARVVDHYNPGEKTPWQRHVIWSEWLSEG